MNTRKFLTKNESLNRKELINRAKELANFEANLNKLCPKKINKTGSNYNSPNVRERLGFCKQLN